MRQESSAPAALQRLVQRAVLGVCVLAWASLCVQLLPMIGARGLLPVQPWLAELSARGVGLAELPTWTWLASSDGALLAGGLSGLALSAIGALGFAPRVCAAISGALYLGLALACRDLLSFQWDNLLIESCFLLALTPSDRESPLSLWLLRLLVFKLYFLSGVAKWQSHLGDWQDGSAMVAYYQTAPLPTAAAWLAYQLPEDWHHLESWGTLALECALPFAILGPRAGRLAALVALTAFQLLNILTANYGFFSHLSMALHLCLLDEVDAQRARAWAIARLPPGLLRLPPPPPPWRRAWDQLLLWPLGLAWLLLSTSASLDRFAGVQTLDRARAAVAPLRIANVYHLFGHITTERVEPELQLLVQGAWQPAHLRFKPGPPERRPPWVAPHQPRLDFRLWFHGLSYERGLPGYLQGLIRGVCLDPEAMQSFFPEPLPPAPEAARVVYWDYRFAPPGADVWWQRALVDATRPIPCEVFLR
ncbi:MAG: lipase maturation factor family protein [Alphaproteobacteria bacterium]|nr:lipase maturation factor family protein [Alphaproteobacteria bacterium]